MIALVRDPALPKIIPVADWPVGGNVTCHRHRTSTFQLPFRHAAHELLNDTDPSLQHGVLLAMEGMLSQFAVAVANPLKADNSAESFEKTLSALATKIAKVSAQNEQLRKSARRLTVSWTLYGGFAYISALLIFTLVTGWNSWGPMEYSVVSGGPVMFVKSIQLGLH
jgi:hypothetical protein